MNARTTPSESRAGAVPSATGERGNGHLGRVTTASLTAGLAVALVLTLVVFPGAGESAVTGGGLLGFALGWALLAVLSQRHSGQPQRWAVLPAAVMAVFGAALVVARPEDGVLNAAGWVWAPVLLVVAVWSMARASRSLATRARAMLVMPVLALLALVSVGGAYQTVRTTLATAAAPAPGRLVDVGGHRLHLDCVGTGSPTVVLESGLGGSSALWSRIADDVAPTARVCAYDRAGQGWSDSTDTAPDGDSIASDLSALLAAAGEAGPYVLVGHSVGGPYVMTFAAESPASVAGLVLLDATSPYDVGASIAGVVGGANGPMALLPSIARMGLTRLAPASTWSNLPSPDAETYATYAATARAMANAVEETAQYGAAFAQAQRLTSFDTRPLVVLTTSDKARHDASGFAAQERLADLSANSSLRTTDTTHIGLLDDQMGAASSARAILDVVTAVRNHTPVPHE